MVNVRFYGALEQFGTRFELDCKDTAEIIRALTSQIPKLADFLKRGLFTVRIGREYIDNRYVEKGLTHKLKDGVTVHFTPVLKGAKRAGVFQTILGAVLVVVGAFTYAYGGQALVSAGVAMMIGGVAQMLTKPPSMPGRGNDAEKKNSTMFSNLSNMVAQGRPMPLAYGLIRTGSLIISQGVETLDVERTTESKKKHRNGFVNYIDKNVLKRG